MKTGRNDKCPCASGKKYKHCCLNEAEEEKLPDFDEVGYFKQFTPLSGILWLQVVLCHPNNSLYTSRLYFLIGLILSIPKNQFGKKEMKYEDAKYLFDTTEEAYAEAFMFVEDFAGFDQCKLIPFFLNRNKYFFFYSNLERPYEQLLQLKETYFFNCENAGNDLFYFQNEIIDSLDFQTHLLNGMSEMPENNVKQENLYIPSENYFKTISAYFFIDGFYPAPTVFHKLGDFKNKPVNEIYNKSIENKLFSKLYIEVEEQIIRMMPHIHLSILVDNGRKLLKKKNLLIKKAHDNYKLRLKDLCRSFFVESGEVVALLKREPDIDLLFNEVDFATIIDHNKLMLFGCVEYSNKENISLSLNKTIIKLNNVRDKIINEEFVGVFERGNSQAYSVRSKALEIWLIPVYEAICLDVLATVKKEVNMDRTFMFNFMDLRPVFKEIENPFDLLKYFKEEEALRLRIRQPFMGEFMDRFLFYIKNGKSHMRSGRSFDFGLFEFHMWSNHIFDESWEKYQDDVYEEIEIKFPDLFSNVEQYKDGIYRMVETVDLFGCYLIKCDIRFIWIYLPPSGRNIERMELHIASDLVAPLISEHIKQFDVSFQNILSAHGIDKYVEYSLVVLPKSLIGKIEEFEMFREEVNYLNEDNPIIFTTKKLRYGQARTFVFFDYKLFSKLFGQEQNIGERYAIKALIKSIVEFKENNAEYAETIAENFINTYLPIGIKGYSFEELNVPNSALNSYPLPQPLNKTDVSVTERILSEYLMQSNINPGDYTGEEAKKINYDIYTFLQNLLETEILKFDSDFIIYAYRQLELSDGHKFLRKINLGMRSKGRTTYDILESTKKSENEQSHLAACIKHIIHTSLKVGNSGANFITAEPWTRLTALADSIMTAAMIYDYIHYDLRDHILRITDDYLIADIVENEVINSENLYTKNTKIKIEKAQKAHSRALKEPKQHNEGEYIKTDINSELDTAFKNDLNFTYEDLIFVLHALSIIPIYSNGRFPVITRSVSELYIEINKIDKKGITENAVNLILNFLCLYNGIYESKDLLNASDMMRNKERINVSPFIKLENDLFLYGNEVVKSAFAFWSVLSSGDFPFENRNLSHIKKVIDQIHRNEDLALEKLVEETAIKILGKSSVEARINNFKRLSEDFKRNEDCGEIDILCINKIIKTVFVMDAKNINKKISIYYIRQSIREFFEGKKSYYSKLLKKKQFVEKNLNKVLLHFGIEDSKDWKVIESFVSEEVYFAAYYKEINVDFVLVEELETYLQNKK